MDPRTCCDWSRSLAFVSCVSVLPSLIKGFGLKTERKTPTRGVNRLQEPFKYSMKKLSIIIFGLILGFGFVEPVLADTVQKGCAVITEPTTSSPNCFFTEPPSTIGYDGDYDVYAGEYPETLFHLFDGTYQSSNLYLEVADRASATTTKLWHILHDVGGDDWVYQFHLDNGVWVQNDPFLLKTRFTLIDSPEDEEVVSSTTDVTFSGYLYINQDDIGNELLTDDWWIEIRIRRDSDNQVQVANIALLDTVLRIDDDTGWVAGYHNFSTTSEPFTRSGRYTVNWKLHRHSIFASITSFFGLESYFNAGVLANSQTHFVIDKLNGYDVAVGSFQESLEDSFASTTLETLTERLATCNPLDNFSVIDCLAGLFTLDSASAENLLTQFKEMIGERAPIGYVTRLIAIMTSATATSSFPMISFTFPAGLGLAGETLEFDFNKILSDSVEIASSTLVSGTDGTSNVWDVLMPTINIILYLVLFMVIVNDITGMHKHTKK